jgi:DNA polymerase (family 10)
MTNDDILELLELTGKLLELHAENEFKVRSYQNAAFSLDKSTADLTTLPVADLARMPGVGKSLAAKIDEIRRTGELQELNDLLSRTPPGVVEMFRIKGIGPKKIRQLWLDLGIDDLDKLLKAAEAGEVASLKGFGEKVQQTILTNLRFLAESAAKLRMNQGEALAGVLRDVLEPHFGHVEITGDVRRRNEVVGAIQLVVGTPDPLAVQRLLNDQEFLQQDEKTSTPFVWRGRFTDRKIPVEVVAVPPDRFVGAVFVRSAGEGHLAHAVGGQTLYQRATTAPVESEESLYASLGLPYISPELREGNQEFTSHFSLLTSHLITFDALRGTVHNHSTWSDGKHSVEQMARAAAALGLEYFGIADHSRSATYAKGLSEDQVFSQQKEVDDLNRKFAAEGLAFTVFKGIEADILGDGALDYGDDVLKTFDYVVASVHSNLTMTQEKAEQRLLRAIENPYTTILGHMTGRLLLSRPGYPVDHRKIIDACAANGVVLELNADPYRLDVDWRWIPYAMEKGVRIAINPDAHTTDGLLNLHYGVAVARKGGLTREMTFNALGRDEIGAYFARRKSR